MPLPFVLSQLSLSSSPTEIKASLVAHLLGLASWVYGNNLTPFPQHIQKDKTANTYKNQKLEQ